MAGLDLRPGSVKRDIGPTLYFSPASSAKTVTVIFPGVEPCFPGITISAGTRNISPSGVAKRVFFTSLTGWAEYALKTVIQPCAFSDARSVPEVGTTAESSMSLTWSVNERVLDAIAGAG